MDARVGVSGFSYPAWKGRFYPGDARPDEFLTHYAGQLNTVEINSSFYAFPSASSVKSWSAKTKEEFVFSFKAPKQITHVGRLSEGSGETANRFFGSLVTLGPRLGPILFQLPPFQKADQSLLKDFLLETSGIRHRVFEFRHESWFEEGTFRTLDDHSAGFCIAESEDVKTVTRVTGGLAYFRLRNESYDQEAIDKWSTRISKICAGLPECYVYLRHDETGENAVMAKRLSQKLRALNA